MQDDAGHEHFTDPISDRKVVASLCVAGPSSSQLNAAACRNSGAPKRHALSGGGTEQRQSKHQQELYIIPRGLLPAHNSGDAWRERFHLTEA